MWISNTATAAMMLPIAHAVLEEIKEENKITTSSQNNTNVITSVKYSKNYNGTDDSEVDQETDKQDNGNFVEDDSRLNNSDMERVEKSDLTDYESQGYREVETEQFEDRLSGEDGDTDNGETKEKVEMTSSRLLTTDSETRSVCDVP